MISEFVALLAILLGVEFYIGLYKMDKMYLQYEQRIKLVEEKLSSKIGHLAEELEKKSTETNGVWGAWSAWTVCSATCNTGLQTRQRNCNNPVPSSAGQYCEGSPTDVDLCNIQHCPQTNGGWGAWSAWTDCSATCNTGLQTRQRQCNNPVPSSGGQYCEGSPMDVVLCNQKHCPRIKSSFTAKVATRLSSGFLSFQTVLLNEGSNFNGKTGTFTSQHSGFYVFIVNVVDLDNDVLCSIRKNSEISVLIKSQNPLDSTGARTASGYGSATGAATLHLTPGDTVNILCSSQSWLVSSSSFTGFLVAEDS